MNRIRTERQEAVGRETHDPPLFLQVCRHLIPLSLCGTFADTVMDEICKPQKMVCGTVPDYHAAWFPIRLCYVKGKL